MASSWHQYLCKFHGYCEKTLGSIEYLLVENVAAFMTDLFTEQFKQKHFQISFLCSYWLSFYVIAVIIFFTICLCDYAVYQCESFTKYISCVI